MKKLVFAVIAVVLLTIEVNSVFAQQNSDQFVPEKYRLVKKLLADINRDGQKELILACQSKTISYDGISKNLSARLVVLHSGKTGWQKIWDFKESDKFPDFLIGREGNGKDNEPILEVKDINQDGYPELVFSFGQTFGAGGLSLVTYVFQQKNGKFLDLAWKKLSHDGDGGVKFNRKFACTWSYIWGSNESHAGPHRYEAKVYRFDGKHYVYQRKFKTVKKGDEGEREVKTRFMK